MVFKTTAFDTSPTNDRTITVWTVNSGGSESDRVTRTATPYRDTLTPTGFNGSRSGATGATWSWNLPTNGRPIDQVQLDGAVNGTFGGNKTSETIDRGPGTYQLRVRAHSAAGWSALDRLPVGHRAHRRTPEVFNVHKGPDRIAPNGVGSCTCRPVPGVNFDISQLPAGGGGWTVECQSARAPSRTSAIQLYPNGAAPATPGVGGACSPTDWAVTGIVVNANGLSPVSVS